MVSSEHRRLVVAMGNHWERFAAYCSHNPESDEDDDTLLWMGPDRETVEEPVADAERHAPRTEVTVEVF